jgi:hypothetical protein
MIDAFICDAIRTPFGRYAGALATIRADDLAAVPLRALMRAQSRTSTLECGRRCRLRVRQPGGERTTATSDG